MRNFDGQVVVVTGSSSGIGESVARSFSAAGAHVVINSSRSVAEGQALAASLPRAIYVRGDIASAQDAQAIVDAALSEWGRLDILVNNAGITRVIPLADIEAATVEVWRRIFEVNVFGTWLMCQKALPALREARGSIVNISSVAGIRASGSSIPYAVSKAALNHLTRLLAQAVGPEVRVNAIAPGLVDTNMTADWAEVRDYVRDATPLGRCGAPQEVADVALGLVGFGYVSGQVIAVDGGGLRAGSSPRATS